MGRDLHGRLAALEAKRHPITTRFETWLDKGDGLLRNGDRVMTREAFRAAFPDAMRIRLNLGNPPGMAGAVAEDGSQDSQELRSIWEP
jgi:hypothetical protein